MPDISSVGNAGSDPRTFAQANDKELNPAAAFKNRNKQPVDRRGAPLPIRKSGYDALDKNSFLKLLVTQLSKQDPTNPMNDREFISQLAQFSSLEQMNNVANSMNKLRGAQANNLIGKMVQGKDFVTDKPIQGIVTSSIFTPNGDVLLKVNGRHIKLDDILEVTEVTPIAPPPQMPVAMPETQNVSRETIPVPHGPAAQKRAEHDAATAAYLENSSTKNITVPKGE
jgi:hypothetical protein